MSKTVLVCCGTGCLANGSKKVAGAFRQLLAGTDHQVECVVKETGCNGFCENGPLVQILPDDITYYKVQVQDVGEIVEKTILAGAPVERLLYKNDAGQRVRSQQENPFYAPQMKVALRNIGKIEPSSVEDYMAHGGYRALKKALTMTGEEIVRELEASGLRGRGGAGFPTGTKWRSAMELERFPKYVACNGDEGDPGAFMDRSILEGDPHSVLEGMAICALAIRAEEGFLYIRDEYGLAVHNVQEAIAQAEARGILGEHILGSDRRLKLSVVRGGGAFVCGESTALMASVEGRVGEPRAKYIRSVQRGLWDCPTVLNNVETLANVPVILEHGGAEFAKLGTERSKGTKVFALVGKVKRTGLVEVPMGVTLRHLIYDIGGGVKGNRPFKAVQTGGPSGGCITPKHLDLPIDYEALKGIGSMMGSGGMIVMDEDDCMVNIAKFFLEFTLDESCGKCTPCRIGNRRLYEMLEEITDGRGTMDTLEKLRTLSATIKDTALCGLGQTSPNPVLSTMNNFEEEYLAHVKEARCPAGVCVRLIRYEITDKCVGCGLCIRHCPVNCISGERKMRHEIDQSRCIKCGACYGVCKFHAVEKH